MSRITITSPGGERFFVHEFIDAIEAIKILEIWNTQGYEAAKNYVSRLNSGACRICGKPKSYHTPGKHLYRPFGVSNG